MAYLGQLRSNCPTTLLRVLTLMDQVKSGELYQCARYALLEFVKSLPISLACSWPHHLSTYPPSKFLVFHLMALVSTHKTKK